MLLFIAPPIIYIQIKGNYHGYMGGSWTCLSMQFQREFLEDKREMSLS